MEIVQLNDASKVGSDYKECIKVDQEDIFPSIIMVTYIKSF